MLVPPPMGLHPMGPGVPMTSMGPQQSHPQQFGYGNFVPGKNYGMMSSPLAHGVTARRSLNLASLLLAVLLPTGLFVLSFCMMTFVLYRHPYTALAVVIIALFATITQAFWGIHSRRLQISTGKPTWHMTMAALGVTMILSGSLLGWINYELVSKTYYDYISLRKAVDVDPAAWQGQQALDVGEVDFKAGSVIDRNLKFLWHKKDTYCVAPLVSQEGARLANYDFWAVGKNCCSAKPGDFSCGGMVYSSWANKDQTPKGLRVMDTEEIRGYKLAIEQAIAAFKIQASRPIFLYMKDSPYQDIKQHFSDAWWWTVVASAFALVVCLAVVYIQAFKWGTGHETYWEARNLPGRNPSGYMDAPETMRRMYPHWSGPSQWA